MMPAEPSRSGARAQRPWPAADAARPVRGVTRLCEEAIAIARQVGARQAEGHAKNTLGVDLNGQGLVDAGNASLRESLAIALEVNDLEGIARAYINLTDVLFLGGDIEGAADVVDEAEPVIASIGMSAYAGVYLLHNGVLINAELQGRTRRDDRRTRRSGRATGSSPSATGSRGWSTSSWPAATPRRGRSTISTTCSRVPGWRAR
jgi:hypothetical protein